MKHIPGLGSLAFGCGLLLSSSAVVCPRPAFANAVHGPIASETEFMLFNQPGYLGVTLARVDSDHASALHLADEHAAEVTIIDHDAPAAKAGIRLHDVILQLDGRPFATVDQLSHRLLALPAGRTITLLVSRDGNHLTFILTLCDQTKLQQQAWLQHISVPAPGPEVAAAPIAPVVKSPVGNSFVGKPASAGPAFLTNVLPKTLYVGAAVNPVRTQLADYFGVISGTGLLVVNVDGQSPAAHAGMKAGDVIVRVESLPMRTRSDWVKAMRRHRGQPVQVTVMRNKQEQLLTLTPGKPRKS